jgi:hypothetical protein
MRLLAACRWQWFVFCLLGHGVAPVEKQEYHKLLDTPGLRSNRRFQALIMFAVTGALPVSEANEHLAADAKKIRTLLPSTFT